MTGVGYLTSSRYKHACIKHQKIGPPLISVLFNARHSVCFSFIVHFLSEFCNAVLCAQVTFSCLTALSRKGDSCVFLTVFSTLVFTWIHRFRSQSKAVQHAAPKTWVKYVQYSKYLLLIILNTDNFQ